MGHKDLMKSMETLQAVNESVSALINNNNSLADIVKGVEPFKLGYLKGKASVTVGAKGVLKYARPQFLTTKLAKGIKFKYVVKIIRGGRKALYWELPCLDVEQALIATSVLNSLGTKSLYWLQRSIKRDDRFTLEIDTNKAFEENIIPTKDDVLDKEFEEAYRKGVRRKPTFNIDSLIANMPKPSWVSEETSDEVEQLELLDDNSGISFGDIVGGIDLTEQVVDTENTDAVSERVGGEIRIEVEKQPTLSDDIQSVLKGLLGSSDVRETVDNLNNAIKAIEDNMKHEEVQIQILKDKLEIIHLCDRVRKAEKSLGS